MLGLVLGMSLYGISKPHIINADFEKQILVIDDYKVVRTVKMIITAYSSTSNQTDDTPFTTASGKYVVEGIVANNMLPFGTKIRIPKIYGDEIFIVEDRMHSRKGKYHIDIWFPNYKEAKNFGAAVTEIEVLES
ncbi:MAG: hypothetical protein AAB340_02640 [Patescibacteria group bacterium]